MLLLCKAEDLRVQRLLLLRQCRSFPSQTIQLRNNFVHSPLAHRRNTDRDQHLYNLVTVERNDCEEIGIQTGDRKEESRRDLQQNALHQKRDKNLFSSYAHDPNDMESILTSSATKSLSPHPSTSDESVIPPHTYASLKQASASKTRSFSRVSSGRKGRVRGGKGRGTRNFPKMPDPRDLLHMKAREQEAYAGQYRQPPPPRQQYVDNNGFYEPPNESIFPDGHDMRGGPFGYEYNGPPGFYELHQPPPPPHDANRWNSSGLVSQSQQMYSQDAVDFGYDAQPIPNGFQESFYASHRPSAFDPVTAPHRTSDFDPVSSQPQFSQMDDFGYDAYDNSFYQSEHQGFSSDQFMQPPPMEAPRGFVQAGPNEEDDDLFQAAFG